MYEGRKQLIAKLKWELGHEFSADDFVIDEALLTMSLLISMTKDGKTLCTMDSDGRVETVQTLPLGIIRQKFKGIN